MVEVLLDVDALVDDLLLLTGLRQLLLHRCGVNIYFAARVNNLIFNDLVPAVFILQTFDTRNELYTQILYTQFIYKHARRSVHNLPLLYTNVSAVNFGDIKIRRRRPGAFHFSGQLTRATKTSLTASRNSVSTSLRGPRSSLPSNPDYHSFTHAHTHPQGGRREICL